MGRGHAWLNGLSQVEAERALVRCCGSSRWVAGMLAQRPFASEQVLYERALEVWSGLTADDYLEAFSHHPEIGASLDALRARFADTSQWSAAEQAGVGHADEATLAALRDENLAYRQRFGFIFIVCASGKSATEMLALLRARLPHTPHDELWVAAQEQAKITALRLEKLAP
jgi:2-oxo-4-hydroxy-4-carboxy-5-ureidoimidazoline decarboxylase